MEKYRMNYETFEISRSTWVPETLMEQRHGQLFTSNLTLPLWNINVNDAAHTSHNTNYLRNSFVKIMYGEFGRTGLNWGLKRCYCHFLTHSHTVRWAQVRSVCKSLVLKGIYTFKWNFPVHFAVTFALNCIHRSLYAEFQMRIHLQNAKPFHILRYALNAIHSSVTICITRAVAIAKSSNIFNSLRCILHITQLTLRTAYT